MSSTQGSIQVMKSDRSGTLTGAWRVLGLTIAGLSLTVGGLGLGGCNNELKDQNAALSKENTELRAKFTEAETQKQQSEQMRVQAEQRAATLQTQISTAATQPAPRMAGGDDSPEPKARRAASGGSDKTIEISSDLLFGPGSATLKPDAKRELDKYVSRFKGASSITIEGHTDSDPIRKSKWPSNQALSKARADAVREYLASKGVSKSKISTVGKGSSEPRGSKKESRRVDIVVAE